MSLFNKLVRYISAMTSVFVMSCSRPSGNVYGPPPKSIDPDQSTTDIENVQNSSEPDDRTESDNPRTETSESDRDENQFPHVDDVDFKEIYGPPEMLEQRR